MPVPGSAYGSGLPETIHGTAVPVTAGGTMKPADVHGTEKQGNIYENARYRKLINEINLLKAENERLKNETKHNAREQAGNLSRNV